MLNHNFEIGDKVSGVRNGSRVWYGTVSYLNGNGIECWEQDFRAYIYIPNHMLYTLTNLTKQQNKDQQMKEHNTKPKNIKPEDEVTITVTYRDLAKMYALLGSVSCTYRDHRLFYRLEKMLDPSGDIRDSVVVNNIPYENRLKYEEYQKEFESALFPEHVETEQQKQIRELREQAEAMQEQSKALLQKAKSLEENQK